MNWKNLKLKGKFSIAFGAIILLLVFVSIFAINGIRGIIGNAAEVIDGNKLKALIVQKEVDHLNWASSVADLLNNDEVTTLNVQTDPTKCGFGRWYYSEEREMAEKLVPELKEYLAAIEEPHNHLHESAIEIQKNFIEVDAKLGTFLAEKRADHIDWMNTARKEILGNKRSLSVQKDPHRCGLGKWMYSEEVKEMAKSNNELAEFLRNVEKPHNDLHDCAYTIDEYLQSNNRNAAVDHLNSTCEFNAQKVMDELNNLVENNNNKLEQFEEARTIYANQTLQDLNKVQVLLKKIIETASNNIMSDDEMLNSASQTSNGVLIFSLIISAFAVILAVVIASGIIKPINKGVAFARKLSEGDLTTTVDVDQKDEIGQLASALNEMAGRLRSIVENILNGADNIAAASQEMSSTSQEMSQGASEQASSVEEVSSSMEEMSANIDQNTDNARGTESIALKAASGIKEGSEATNIAVDGMKNIAEKIRIVNDIAFQTNILALNAAVEAARAGEHGKGFAVVAAEVRKLAERSKVAAEEIDELSRNGVVAAENAGNKLIEIVPEIEKTAQLVQEIASASMEQSAGAEQVNNAMQQLNNVTQQNAAASEELATGSEELASQAEQLKETIRFFNIGQRRYNTLQKSSNVITSNSSNGSDKTSLGSKPSGEKINLEMEKTHVDDNEFEKY